MRIVERMKYRIGKRVWLVVVESIVNEKQRAALVCNETRSFDWPHHSFAVRLCRAFDLVFFN